MVLKGFDLRLVLSINIGSVFFFLVVKFENFLVSRKWYIKFMIANFFFSCVKVRVDCSSIEPIGFYLVFFLEIGVCLDDRI